MDWGREGVLHKQDDVENAKRNLHGRLCPPGCCEAVSHIVVESVSNSRPLLACEIPTPYPKQPLLFL